uniref:Uncharacterized protein n=1 Tax=Rhizophora mucronata TaxID=61149 RepID=A0A2P2QQF7_RHIMU
MRNPWLRYMIEVNQQYSTKKRIN